MESSTVQLYILQINKTLKLEVELLERVCGFTSFKLTRLSNGIFDIRPVTLALHPSN